MVQDLINNIHFIFLHSHILSYRPSAILFSVIFTFVPLRLCCSTYENVSVLMSLILILSYLYSISIHLIVFILFHINVSIILIQLYN